MPTVRTLMSLLVVTCIASYGGRQSQLGARVEHDGLAIEFSPRCDGQVISLLGTIENVGSETQTIRSGSLPWEYETRHSCLAPGPNRYGGSRPIVRHRAR